MLTFCVEREVFSIWYEPFQLTLLLSEFQLDQLHHNDGEKDARTGRREPDRGKVNPDDEPGLTCPDKFFDCAESDCVEKPGDTQKHPVEQIGRVQGILTQKNTIKTQRRQKDAVLDVGTRKLFASGNSGNSGTEGSDKAWPHNLHISTN